MLYYPHHIGDFVRDTSRLNDSQSMAYLRLIWLYYESEQPLTDDIEALAFRIGSDFKTVEMLLKCYFYANASRWHHKRIDSEINAYRSKSKKASESAKARWQNAKHMRTHNESNANQEPITNNQETSIKTKARAPSIEKPDRVSQSTWDDWLQLRKAKKAPVTGTVLKRAVAEASKAGMELEHFLQVWCARGSQGLQADWLKPRERTPPRTTHDLSQMDYSKGVGDDGSF